MAYRDYTIFAEFYDAAMGDRSGIIRDLFELVEKYQPAARYILELAVGTGTVLQGLADNYQVSGIDMSPAMLAMARQKLPGAKLVQGDMADFDLGKTFDVVFCVFDSINHLPKFEQWENTFKRAADHLTAGGLFIFDMNTLGRFERLVRIARLQEDFADKSLDVKINRLSPSVLQFAHTFYEYQNGQKQPIGQAMICETAFPIERVRQAAERYFEPLEIIDQSGNLPSDELDRTFFVYRKQT